MSTGSTTTAAPRSTIGAILQKVLSHESGLAATAHAFEWRVRGSPLQSIKRLFAEQSRQIDRWLGDVSQCAQRVGIAAAAVAQAERRIEAIDSGTAPRVAASELLQRHEALAHELRASIDLLAERDPNNDAVPVLDGLLDFHETSAWMLRLLLETPERSRLV
jgi:DNA-binding ferritin-like protein